MSWGRITAIEFQPYLADELFYDFDVQQLNRNRVSAGAEFKIVGSLKAGLYYMLESRKAQGDWTAVNILGTNLRYSF